MRNIFEEDCLYLQPVLRTDGDWQRHTESRQADLLVSPERLAYFRVLHQWNEALQAIREEV